MRPNLTYITQSKPFIFNKTVTGDNQYLFLNTEKTFTIKITKDFENIIENLSGLVQIAEMAHDMLQSNPDSMSFKIIEEVLNNLKIK